MRKMLAAVLVAGLLWLFSGSAGPVVNAGDSVPDGNGALPIPLIGGDRVPDGNG
ncbi:MAG: hypothetical protein ACRDGN_00945 [bacterium]